MRPTAMEVREAHVGPIEDCYHPVELHTNRGTVQARYYRVPLARRAVIMVGGVGGGWDSPASGLYHHLAEAMQGEAISTLRVRFRHPGDLDECVMDVFAGLSLLEADGHTAIALVGHSFGGAVVIQAAAVAKSVRTVVAIATQSYGAEPVCQLPPPCSILLLHGMEDTVLPTACSEQVFRLAPEPKRLKVYNGAGHCLDEVAEEVRKDVHDWLRDRLTTPPPW